MSYSTINTAKCAISKLAKTVDGRNIGTDPDICTFMRGIFELRTPAPKVNKTWDTAVLLEHFRSIPNNEELKLKDLTKKLSALLMIESAQRVQTLSIMKTSDIKWYENSCTILVSEKVKQTRPGYHLPAKSFEKKSDDIKVCVYSCLKHYTDRTSEFRKEHRKLFLCYKKPYRPASKDTIAKWLEKSLRDAGIENYTSHSYRSAATSEMFNSGIGMQTILKTAGWTNENTFRKYYLKKVDKEALRGAKSNCQKTMLNYFQPK